MTMISIVTIFVLLEREQSREASIVVTNSPWAAFQLHAEAMRTQVIVSDMLAAPTMGADQIERLRERFDIFYSRIGIFSGSRAALGTPFDPAVDGLVPGIIADADAMAAALETRDHATARPVLEMMQARIGSLVPVLAGMLSRVHQIDTERRWTERLAVRQLHVMLASAVVGLALSMLGLLGVLVWQMRASAATQARAEAMERENLATSLALTQRDEQAARLRREAELAETIGAFNRRMNASVTRLAAMIEDIAERSALVTRVVEQARAGSESASASSSRAAQQVSSVAQTADAISLAARDMATKTAETTLTANDASGEAERTGMAIQQLAAAATHISSITKLIASIARRTNLLALNAAIEAARAGEAGRGFAVVAAEVKSLAQQTHEATSDIARQVGEIQSAAGSCIEAMDGIRARISSLGTIGVQIAAIVEDQSLSVSHVATMIRDVTEGRVGSVVGGRRRVPRRPGRDGSSGGGAGADRVGERGGAAHPPRHRALPAACRPRRRGGEEALAAA